jgi:hypothetical protein
LEKGWAVTTGPNTGLDVIVPGRQDINPVFRSADIICGTVPPLILEKSKIHLA